MREANTLTLLLTTQIGCVPERTEPLESFSGCPAPPSASRAQCLRGVAVSWSETAPDKVFALILREIPASTERDEVAQVALAAGGIPGTAEQVCAIKTDAAVRASCELQLDILGQRTAPRAPTPCGVSVPNRAVVELLPVATGGDGWTTALERLVRPRVCVSELLWVDPCSTGTVTAKWTFTDGKISVTGDVEVEPPARELASCWRRSLEFFRPPDGAILSSSAERTWRYYAVAEAPGPAARD